MAAGLPLQAAAQFSADSAESRVVLELYTAQGCAACPPADAMLAELAGREDVIALALHVDYWDYMGWTDTFGQASHTRRQTRYARRHGASTIYTPQVVINGTQIVEGFRTAEVMEALATHGAQPSLISLSLERRGAEDAGAEDAGGEAADRLHITLRLAEEPPSPLALAARAATNGTGLMGLLEGAPDAPPARLHLVRYVPQVSVDIHDGENAGRRGAFHNVVTEWTHIGDWDMVAPLEMSVAIEGSDPAVVILQEAGQGSILGAARLR